MSTKTLRGCLKAGLNDAKNWDMDAIRRATGCSGLRPGTLNVELDAPHELRVDATLYRKDRADGRNEDLYFERCHLMLGESKVPAWIARTNTNFHGKKMLEIMAEEPLRERYGLKDNDCIDVQIFME
jgi:CTP-dependent riboflavin kinase